MEWIENYEGLAIYKRNLKKSKETFLWQILELEYCTTKFFIVCETLEQVKSYMDEIKEVL